MGILLQPSSVQWLQERTRFRIHRRSVFYAQATPPASRGCAAHQNRAARLCSPAQAHVCSGQSKPSLVDLPPGVRALNVCLSAEKQSSKSSACPCLHVAGGFSEPYALQGSIARQSGRGPLSQPSETSNATSQASSLFRSYAGVRRRFTRGRSPRLSCFLTSPHLTPRFSSRNKQRNLMPWAEPAVARRRRAGVIA
ncbi:hypothetical protein V8C42DRAFT_324406 [Trichoderma barbatum]